MNLLDIIAKAKDEKATSLDLSQMGLRILPPTLSRSNRSRNSTSTGTSSWRFPKISAC